MAKKYRVEGGCQCCMTCLYECPAQAISIVEDISAKIDEEKCLGCGSCYDVCQPGAIVEYEA